ncbi:MAG: HNH endonuclease [Cyclobacteriaceae bacterium]|nr:HNH endonuclease [Cyclobacteriaceae bacterium SS2]
MNDLYKFINLSDYLDSIGIPPIEGKSSWKVIKGIDFEEAYKAGKISFEEDGIYLNYEGSKYRGYMFIKTPYIDRYGSYPRFHLTRCEVIQEFIDSGRFNSRYEWSNSNVNDLIDKTTGRLYNDEILDYCSKCKSELLGTINNTSDFHDLLRETNQIEDEVTVDIFGYIRGWKKISKAYRERQGYECENCGITPREAMHRRYWHVHHLKDKSDNNINSLQCLCILCHSKSNETHEKNFNTRANQRELTNFIKLYKEELRKRGIRFDDNYEIDT